MKLKKLKAGPLVGHTTANSARIWAKGAKGECLVVRYKSTNNQYVVITPEPFWSFFDYTCVVEIKINSNVTNQKVSYQAVSICERDLESLDELNTSIDWSKIKEFTFNLFPDSNCQEVSFILGSCRHQGVGLGLGFLAGVSALGLFTRRSFALNSISKLAREESIDFLLFAGDQVYCDMPKHYFGISVPLPISPLTYKSYCQKNYKAFKQRPFKNLTSVIPTYMIFDDHEIKNDWSRYNYQNDNGEDIPGEVRKLESGLRCYQAYQANHGPSVELEGLEHSIENFTPLKSKHYYTFSCGDTGYFVLDVRSEREKPDSLGISKMVSSEQFDELANWLKGEGDRQGRHSRVKFIVSPVPVLPDVKGGWHLGAPKDVWTSYPLQRKKLLKLAYDNKNVFFLSGDVHCSYISQADFCDNGENKTLYNIVSSALNWPMIGLQDGWSFDTQDLKWVQNESEFAYIENSVQQWPEKVITRNNFCKIDVNSDFVSISFYFDTGQKVCINDEPVLKNIDLI